LIKKDYSETIADLQKNLSISRYQKEVMVVEVGGVDEQVQEPKELFLHIELFQCSKR
jgi:arabinogalactan endo-1,4-beta-galactosidase